MYEISAQIISTYIVPVELDQDGIGVTVEIVGPQGPPGETGATGAPGSNPVGAMLQVDYDPNGNGNKVANAEHADQADFATDTFLFGGEDPSMYMKYADYVSPTLLEVLDQDNSAGTRIITNLGTPSNAYEAANKFYVDQVFNSGGRYRGDIDASSNPNYPAAIIGDRYEIRVAGRIGGASGPLVDVYDEIICKADTVAGDHATVGTSWYIIQGNLEKASETVNGYIRLATEAETIAGTDPEKAISPSKLAAWWTNIKDFGSFTFSGVVNAATAATGTISNRLATCSFVAQEIAARLTDIVTFSKRADFVINNAGDVTGATNWDLTYSMTRMKGVGNVTLSITNKPGTGKGGTFIVYFWQDSTGSRTLSFTASQFRNVPTSINTAPDSLTIITGIFSAIDDKLTLQTITDTTAN